MRFARRSDHHAKLHVVAVDVGRAHHLLRERDEAEPRGNVEEHEEPRLPEEAVASIQERDAQKSGVTKLKRGNAMPEALHLNLRLFEEEARGDHRERIENRIGVENIGDAVVDETLELEHGDGRPRRAPMDAAEENRRESRAESERDDWQSRRNRLVLGEPEHHRLHWRDVDDACAEADEEAVAEVDHRERLHVDAGLRHEKARKEERRTDDCRKPDVLLDNLPEERRAHA